MRHPDPVPARPSFQAFTHARRKLTLIGRAAIKRRAPFFVGSDGSATTREHGESRNCDHRINPTLFHFRRLLFSRAANALFAAEGPSLPRKRLASNNQVPSNSALPWAGNQTNPPG